MKPHERLATVAARHGHECAFGACTVAGDLHLFIWFAIAALVVLVLLSLWEA